MAYAEDRTRHRRTEPRYEEYNVYALIEIRAIFENRIKTYITNAGRLVIPQNLPYALVVMVRNVRGEEINDLTQVQRPTLPVGPPMVRDIREPPLRDDQYAMGTNTGGINPIETTTVTRAGRELRGNFHQFIHR